MDISKSLIKYSNFSKIYARQELPDFLDLNIDIFIYTFGRESLLYKQEGDFLIQSIFFSQAFIDYI